MKKLLSYFVILGTVFAGVVGGAKAGHAMDIYNNDGVNVALDGSFAGYAVYENNDALYGKRWQAIGYGNIGASIEKEFEDFSVGIHTALKAVPETQYSDEETKIGEIYASIENNYGRIELGNTPNISRKIHIFTPDVAIMDMGGTNGLDYILRKNDVALLTTTAINTDENKTKVSYVSPKFYGLQIAGSYIPRTKDVDVLLEEFEEKDSNEIEDGFTYGVKYSYSGDVDFKLSASVAKFNVENENEIINDKKTRDEYSLGALLYRKGLQFTTSYRHIKERRLLEDGEIKGYVADAGIAYEIGPLSTSITQRHSKIVDEDDLNTREKENNRMDLTLLSAKYELNKYTAFSLGSGRIAFDGEDNHKNVGVLFITGIILNI